jgi:ankyrin repeat protein
VFGFFRANEENFYNELLKDELDVNKIKKFILRGIDLNKKDEKGRTILFSLVSKRKVDSIRYLLKFDLDINSEDNYGKTVLDHCIDKSDGMMIRFLLENGASVNRFNSSNRTPLQDCALNGNYRIFEILMKYNPDFTIYDDSKNHILFDAIKGSNIVILKDIVNHLSNLNVLDSNNQTALFEAVLLENPEIAKCLILNGINVNFIDKNGQNVLFNSVILGERNFEIIELLIKKEININIVDNNNKNILDEILHIIDLQKPRRTKKGKYKLIKDSYDYTKIVKLLISNGFEIDKVHDEKTTLQIAIEKKDLESAKFLIECGANINYTDLDERTILSKEIIKGYDNYQVIDFLIENGVNLNHKDIDEKTVVDDLVDYIAIERGFKDLTNLDKLNYVKDGKYDILLKKVLSKKPNIDVKRLDGKNILFDLVLYNDYETLKILINSGINLNIQDSKGNTPLHHMVEDGLKIEDKKLREEFIERLVFFLKFRVNVDIQDNEGRTVFHKSVIANDLKVTEKLLTKKANLSLKDKHGRTALHHTQWNGNYKIARWLIAAGADMNIPDKSGFTLLNYAAIFGHLELVMALIASGVLMYNKNPKNKKVAKFFKEKEPNLNELLKSNISDDKMRKALNDVVENLRNEINEAL